MEKYTLEPARITLEEFYWLTRNKELLPGRVLLHELMEERFLKLSDAGIVHMGSLIKSMRSKEDVSTLSAITRIPVNYLLLLKREAGSYLARPFPLSHIPGIPFEYTEILKTIDIRHTRDFFERVQTGDDRIKISARTGIPLERLKEIFNLTDLSRITGVGAIFARVIYEAGITSVCEFAGSEAESQYRACLKVVEKHGYDAGHFSSKDIQYCIDYAKVVCRLNSKNGK
jgi:hypothetical protein